MTGKPMTTDERIAEMETWLWGASHKARSPFRNDEIALIAIACELRALRLMLREEIREAAWPLKRAHGDE